MKIKGYIVHIPYISVVALLLFVVLVSCGGGGGGSTSSSSAITTAGMTDGNGQVTLSASGKPVTFRLRDMFGNPVAGAAVGINMDTGRQGIGVMLISDPGDNFPPMIRILVGTGGTSASPSLNPKRSSAADGANLESASAPDEPVLVTLFGKKDVGPTSGAVDDAIGILEVAGIQAPPAIGNVLTGVQLVNPLVSLANSMNTILGGRIGNTLLKLGFATKETITVEELTADLRAANVQNGVKLFVLAGITLSTLNPLTAEQAGGVVLDAGLNYYNSQIYGACRSGTVDKVVAYGFTLGYACAENPLYSLYGHIFDAKSNGQPMAGGSYQMVSKGNIGFAIAGVLDSNGSATVNLPAGDYDVIVVPPPGSGSALVTNEIGITVADNGSPINVSNFTLSVGKGGTGDGTVSSNPSKPVYNSGEVVSLTATPNSDSSFSGWSGACSGTGSCVVTMDSAKTVTATFTLTNPIQEPNLTPYKPTAWSDKIVVSNGAGTPMLSTDTLYVDWAVANNGLVSPSNTFTVQLFVDGIAKSTWSVDPPLPHPNYYVSISDFSIGSLGAGTHTVKILADSTGTVDESNENDNEYTKSITVIDSPPGEVTGIAFSGGVGGWGSFINVEITPDGLDGISITCDWEGNLGSRATRTTTTLHSNATCSNADVAWWTDTMLTITATVTGTTLSVSIIY